MTGPVKQYTKELNKKFGYFATWEPNRPLALGDVGVLNRNVFRKLFNIGRRFKTVKYNEYKDPTAGNIEYNSAGGVSFSIKLAGAAPTIGSALTKTDAGISIEFKNENAIAFKANKTLNPSIDDTVALGDQIEALYKLGKWMKEWVVITEIIKAESATILISNQKGSKLELKANSNVKAAHIDIADASFKFSPVVTKGIATKIIANNGLTPLFKVMGLKSSWIRPTSFAPRGIGFAQSFSSPGFEFNEQKHETKFQEIAFEDW